MGFWKTVGSIAGTAIGGAVGGSTGAKIGGALGSSVGGAIGGGGGGGGSGTSAQAPTFTPYAVTSGFGTSSIDPNARTASYTLDPKYAALRDQFLTGSSGAMPQQYQIDTGNMVSGIGTGLFGEASSMNINDMTKSYLANQISLLEPGRAQESSRLNDLMFSKGTLGQGVGMGGGYVNPQQYAQAMAREQQNAALAVAAEDRARSIQADTYTQAGALYGLGQSYLTQPYENANTLLGYGVGIENLGLGTMATGMNMGSTATTSNQNAAHINQGINQQNYLNSLYKSNANADQWGDLINSVGSTDWGGLFGGGSNYDMLPDSQSFDYYNS
jgi:hypothetical protein